MGEQLDIGALLSALKNEDNETVMDLNHKKIDEIKNDMLSRLKLSENVMIEFQKSLKDYRYIDELPEINYGRYVRWIPLKNVNVAKLTSGGFVCDVKIDDGINIVCKNARNRHFQFKMGDCLIFQKLSQQEQVLLSAMDYIN